MVWSWDRGGCKGTLLLSPDWLYIWVVNITLIRFGSIFTNPLSCGQQRIGHLSCLCNNMFLYRRWAGGSLTANITLFPQIKTVLSIAIAKMFFHKPLKLCVIPLPLLLPFYGDSKTSHSMVRLQFIYLELGGPGTPGSTQSYSKGSVTPSLPFPPPPSPCLHRVQKERQRCLK